MFILLSLHSYVFLFIYTHLVCPNILIIFSCVLEHFILITHTHMRGLFHFSIAILFLFIVPGSVNVQCKNGCVKNSNSKKNWYQLRQKKTKVKCDKIFSKYLNYKHFPINIYFYLKFKTRKNICSRGGGREENDSHFTENIALRKMVVQTFLWYAGLVQKLTFMHDIIAAIAIAE